MQSLLIEVLKETPYKPPNRPPFTPFCHYLNLFQLKEEGFLAEGFVPDDVAVVEISQANDAK